jgi:hypothetical protein
VPSDWVQRVAFFATTSTPPYHLEILERDFVKPPLSVFSVKLLSDRPPPVVTLKMRWRRQP